MDVLWLLLAFAAAASATDDCNIVCPAIYDPVCGDDGLTYPNQCSLEAYNCETNSNIQVDYNGECEKKVAWIKDCNMVCQLNYQPVCGDDGKTYPNQCALDVHNCLTDSNVQVAYQGECKKCNVVCPAIYAPVCGTDGETYPNQCAMDVRNCQTDSNVEVDYNGKCGKTVVSKKDCNMMCQLNYQPVCGDDGKTYPNQCALDVHNCLTDSNVQVAYQGECKKCNVVCPANYAPVCGTDGETYPNQCAMDVLNCQTDSNVEVAYPGECKECNLACYFNYDPVCGTDGKTYPNQCAMEVHNCQTNSNVQVDHKGECGQKLASKKECDMACPLNYEPVCGDDGITYPNECSLDVLNCVADSNVQVAYPGECKNCTLVCTDDYSPVCGTDGVTYPNQCAMDMYNCWTDSNVQVDHKGECKNKAALKGECDLVCPANYQPVCGTDGVTYDNQCTLEVHNCLAESSVIVAYEGECDENCIVPCPNCYDPVCGTDGLTYSNPCQMGVHNCFADPDVEMAHMGTCEEKASPKGECDLVCPANYEPVCGTDGLTYGNQCMLDVYNCVSGSSVLVDHPGECEQ